MMLCMIGLLLRPCRGAEYCDQPVCLCVCVCVSASVYLETLEWSAQNFVCRSPVVMARTSSGGVAIHYVLPVFWMTSHLAVMGATLKGGGCTRAPCSNSDEWRGNTGAESNVYECLVVIERENRIEYWENPLRLPVVTRHTSHLDSIIPRTRTKFRDRVFSVAGLTVWNSLQSLSGWRRLLSAQQFQDTSL